MDLTGLFPLVALVAIFYLLVLRPQQKRNKLQLELQSSLVPGDRIIMYSGMYATVVEVGDPLVVRIADGVEVEIVAASVSRKVEPADEVATEELVDNVADSTAGDENA